MKIEFYREQDWLFSGEDGICTKIAFQDADTRSHNHNYYEFFLVGTGSATHHINDKKKIVNTGAQVFIRPKDVHRFQNPSSDFCFYNLLVSRGTMDSCFSFLGNGCNAEQLMENEMPPFRQLLPAELNNLLPSFEQLSIAHELNPVSYTHLDVYKRQIPCRRQNSGVSKSLCNRRQIRNFLQHLLVFSQLWQSRDGSICQRR